MIPIDMMPWREQGFHYHDLIHDDDGGNIHISLLFGAITTRSYDEFKEIARLTEIGIRFAE